jgi:hydroxymethylbilane synthase
MGKTIYIATRGSALALAQANLIMGQCRQSFPGLAFELKIIKTTGDKLQTLNLANPQQEVTKGLFTKELEIALLNGEADLAVHSLKDLPTELPEGLVLGAATRREDVRDVLIYLSREKDNVRGLPAHAGIKDFQAIATIATSSTRRQAQLLAARPDIKVISIRGNVGTRLQKLVDRAELHGLVLAMAGLNRLDYRIRDDGVLEGKDVSEGLLAVPLTTEEMLPCVGQAALGIEIRRDDEATRALCEKLNDTPTFLCVTAERAFLAAMGGGCLSPVAALAEIQGEQIHLRAISFRNESLRRGEISGPKEQAKELGNRVAAQLK